MKISRSEPGFVVSSVVHAGLLLGMLVLFSDAHKFDDAVEMIPIDVVSESQLNQIMKGEKTAREIKPTPRVDKVAAQAETKPQPPLADAKKDTPSPPPPAPRLPEPSADDAPPTPPKRVAALPPKPEPQAKPEDKPLKPVAKPKAAAPEPEKEEPQDAEVVKQKPPAQPKPEKAAKETPAPEKPKAEPRLKTDEVAKLLEKKKLDEKPVANKEAEPAEKPAQEAKPRSDEENAPKSKFNAASIADLLSRETPQRKAATGKEAQTAALGLPTGAAAKLSASMEARIAAYIHDHYHPCWASALTLGGQSYAPVVEFHLSREGELEGRPRLLNASANPTEHARGEQAMQAVRRCSPMRIPPEFMPYYEEALREVTIRFQDSN